MPDRVLVKRLIQVVKEFKIHDDDFSEFSESLRESIGDETIWDQDKPSHVLTSFPVMVCDRLQ